MERASFLVRAISGFFVSFNVRSFVQWIHAEDICSGDYRRKALNINVNRESNFEHQFSLLMIISPHV